MILAGLRQAIAAEGLCWRGGFHPCADDCPDGARWGTIVLLGFAGPENWTSFASAPEAEDSKPDPLDRWSRRVIGALAAQWGVRAIFPFDGPPWAPFLRWAQQAEPVHPSPLGMLIHPDWGLWHAWRGALAFAERFDLPEPDRRASPCDGCATRPCLTACPVGAFTPAGYDVAVCTAHLDRPEGADCRELGCRARRACPVGAEHRYTPAEAQFHMRAFRKAQRPRTWF